MNNPQPVKYAGVPVDIGGTVYIVPPLSLKQVRQLEPNIQVIQDRAVDAMERLEKINAGDLSTAGGGPKFPEIFENNLPIALAALNRNYGDITSEFLEEHLDVDSLRAITSAALQSGAKRTRDTTQGEVLPVENQ